MEEGSRKTKVEVGSDILGWMMLFGTRWQKGICFFCPAQLEKEKTDGNHQTGLARLPLNRTR